MLRRFSPLPAALVVVTACAGRVAPSDPIVTDRPDFTESVQSVPRGWVQVEGGYTASRDAGVASHTSGELLLRAGLGDRAELRVGVPSYTVAGSGAARVSGFEDASLGTKLVLGAGDSTRRWIPAAALIVATSLPTGHDAFRSDVLVPETKLGFGWDLAPRVSLTTNLNAALPEGIDGRYAELAASSSFGLALNERVGAYAEYFGFYPQTAGESASHYVNGGTSLLVSPHLQLDARAGRGVGPSRGDWFVGFGVSRRW